MINKHDKNINNTENGYNVRITKKSKDLLEKIKQKNVFETGVNKPFSAIVGELIHLKAVEMGI